MEKKNKAILLGVIGALLLVTVLVGVSYAYWMLSFTQEEKNQINTACFDITFDDSDTIHLEKAYPMTDEEGKSLTPYKVTVTNKCEEYASYQVNLEILNTTTMDLQYMKISMNNVISVLNTNQVVEPTVENAVTSYRLDTGYLDKLESKTFEIGLWLDYEAPIETAGKILESKVTIQTAYSKNYPANVLAARGCTSAVSCKDTTRVFQTNYINNATKIVFQNKMEAPIEFVASFDESESKDGSIKAYVVANEDGATYTIYFQTKGKFTLPSDSSYYFAFSKVEEVEGLQYVDTSNVTNMDSMFYGMSSLTSLDLSPFDTSQVTNMSSMFAGMSNLTNLDLTPLDTSNVTDMSAMFRGMENLSNLDVGPLDTSNVTDMSGMFSNMFSLTSIDVSSLNTSKVKDMSNMFENSALTELDLSTFDTSSITDMYKTDSMLSMESLVKVNLSNWVLKDALFMSIFGSSNVAQNVKEIIMKNVSINGITTSITDRTSGFLYGVTSVENLDLSNWNLGELTSLKNMFRGMNKVKNLNLTGWNTSNITDMSYMFFGMSSLETLDISHFDTSSVTNMESMFSNMSGLTSLDLSTFNTSKVTKMGNMFLNMSSLTNLDVSHFDTSKVTDMKNMFAVEVSGLGQHLINLDLSSFDTRNVTNMSDMFAERQNLTNITYGENFIRKDGSNISYMFNNCPANKPTHESWAGAF